MVKRHHIGGNLCAWANNLSEAALARSGLFEGASYLRCATFKEIR